MSSQDEVDTLLEQYAIGDVDAFKAFIMESRDINNDLTCLKSAETAKVDYPLNSMPESSLNI